MEFREIMRQFGAKIGIPDLEPDDTNACHIKVDDMNVSFAEDPESATIMTWSVICEPPSDGEEMLNRMLMETMFMGRGTAGSTFSIEPESGKICLHRVDPTAVLDLDSFSAMLGKFVDLLDHWRKTIAEFTPAAVADRKSDASEISPIDYQSGGFMQV